MDEPSDDASSSGSDNQEDYGLLSAWPVWETEYSGTSRNILHLLDDSEDIVVLWEVEADQLDTGHAEEL